MFDYVGNDIIDLAKVEPDKHLEKRFVQRICTAREQELLEESSEPDLLLWHLWACKETAFKLISKIGAPPTFAHRKFECMRFSQFDAGAEAIMQYGDHSFQVALVHQPEYIHAVGHFRDATRVADGDADIARISAAKKRELSDWRSLLTDRESATITRFESAFVRFRCKEAVANRFGLEIGELEIPRPTREHQSMPPHLLIDGERSEIDISLSHHGDWAGWAYNRRR